MSDTNRTLIGEENFGPFKVRLFRNHWKGCPIFLRSVVYTEEDEYVGDLDHAKFFA